MWGVLILFGLLVIGLLHEKAQDKAEERAYNNGYCPKCGKRMTSLCDEWGNTTGFGCTKCGHRASDRYIGSEFKNISKK